jgi:hypothetical protein
MVVSDVKEPEGSKPLEAEAKPAEVDKPVEAKPAEAGKPKKRVPWVVWVLIALVIIAAGWAAYARYGEEISEALLGPAPKNSSDSNSSANSVNSASNNTTTASGTKVTKVVDTGVTWKNPPVKLADQGLFAASADSENIMGGYEGTTYYSVGVNANGAEIIVTEVNVGIGSPEVHRFLKSPVGTFTRLVKNSHELNDEMGYTHANFTDDSATAFLSLTPDKSIVKGETALTYQFDGTITAVTGYTAGTKLDDTKWGDLKVEKGADATDSAGTVKVSRYYILLNDSTKAYYSVKPTFLRDDGTFNATFSDSSKSSIAFDQIKTSGCGNGVGSFPLVVSTTATAGKVQVASTAGSKVYSFNDSANSLIQFGYKVYQVGQEKVQPVAQFMSDLGLVVWTDAYGNTITYSNRSYAPLAECGKPVIYLYPKEETKISVRVGADITKSDPEYGKGWDVIASPSGKLVTDNGSRDYLFWEGIGYGEYPQVKSGSIVLATEAVAKTKADLKTIGLNDKEIADFVEFWGPKMPKEGYVRLTWFLNEEMNKLAPLTVSPKPDSAIRVFLDFSPVVAGTTIAPQTLPTYQRDGFTLVEWGGLLRK